VNFKASQHHTWIQDARDPKRAWLKMQYCVMREEVEWVIKDWPMQWQQIITKPTTRTGTTQLVKPKYTSEARSSPQTGSLAGTTQTTTTWIVPSGSTILKKPRKIPTTARTGSQPKAVKKKPTQGQREVGHDKTSGAQRSRSTKDTT
jgi:hypothetical protein